MTRLALVPAVEPAPLAALAFQARCESEMFRFGVYADVASSSCDGIMFRAEMLSEAGAACAKALLDLSGLFEKPAIVRPSWLNEDRWIVVAPVPKEPAR